MASILLTPTLQAKTTTGDRTVLVSPSATQSLVHTWEEPQEPQDPRGRSACAQMPIRVVQKDRKEKRDQTEHPDQKESLELVMMVSSSIPNLWLLMRTKKLMTTLVTLVKISLSSPLTSM